VRWKSLERKADLDTFGDLKQFCRQACPGKRPEDGIDPAFFATMEGLILEAGHNF
jgi:hypothetical protein